MSSTDDGRREAEFADEAEARGWLEQQLANGFEPSAVYRDGIVPCHRYYDDHVEVTWLVVVEEAAR